MILIAQASVGTILLERSGAFGPPGQTVTVALQLNGLAIAAPQVGAPLNGQVTATSKTAEPGYAATFNVGGIITDSQGNVLTTTGGQAVGVGPDGIEPNHYEAVYWTADDAVSAAQAGQVLTMYFGDFDAMAANLLMNNGQFFGTGDELVATVKIPGGRSGGGSTSGTSGGTSSGGAGMGGGGGTSSGGGGTSNSQQPPQQQPPAQSSAGQQPIVNPYTRSATPSPANLWAGLSTLEKAGVIAGGVALAGGAALLLTGGGGS